MYQTCMVFVLVRFEDNRGSNFNILHVDDTPIHSLNGVTGTQGQCECGRLAI